MVSKNFIRCCNCQAIHHVTPFDKSSTYSYVGNELREEATDDRRRFFQQHAGHRLEPLKTTGEQFFPSGSPADPMSTGYIEVTNGRERFVLRRTRTSIEEPLTFELISGQLNELGRILEVQEKAIRNEMKYHFSPASDQLTDDQIDLFIRLVKQVVQAIDARTVRLSDVSCSDGRDFYGRLGTPAIESLMSECAAHFSARQLESVRRFTEAHRDGCDVMTIVMRRRWTIEQPAG